MEAPIIVEVLDRFAKIKERIKVREFPCRIGRDYSNDIIIEDPYVSPRHIEILQDGNKQLLITDHSSDNGLYTLHPLTRHDDLLIEEDQRIRIGHTNLRFRSENFLVEDTVPLRAYKNRTWGALSHFLFLPLVLIALALALITNTYLEETREIVYATLLSPAFDQLVFVFVWAFAWSIASKIVTHRFYFAFHCIWFGLFNLVGLGLADLYPIIEFNIPVNHLATILESVSDVLLYALLFYGHLRFSSTYSRKKTRRIAVVAALVIVTTMSLFSIITRFNPEYTPQFSSVVKPPALHIGDSKTLDEFFDNTEPLTKFKRHNSNSAQD